jgi:hypothetical protein
MDLTSFLKLIGESSRISFHEIERSNERARLQEDLEEFSPNHDDSVICGKLYVTVQTMARTRIRVAGNTIPTAREEQDVVHFRGESRPALFPACDPQPDNFLPSIPTKLTREVEGAA